jgi:polysaccharide pyruvyl transferase WcaK-like protein
MKHYLLYGHGGSYNHGSEASVKCDIELLRKISPGCRITLSSHFPEQDVQFGIDADEIIGRNLNGKTNEEIYADTISRITPGTTCLSVGGDIYCYPNWQRYAAIHNAAKKVGANSILWSCSLESSMIDDEMLDVLRTHDLITARESITADYLKKLGLNNVVLVSDIAFGLRPEETDIPNQKYVSINLSPLVIRKNPNVLSAYQALVDKILEETEHHIAFVPHVEVSVDNDKDALDQLHGDESRIFRVPTGLTAAKYKYIIGNSEICVASRTHATIAAWSSGVPALAIGYSTKAIGIARDLDQETNCINISKLNASLLCSKFMDLNSGLVEERRLLGKKREEMILKTVPDEIIRFLR